MRSTHIHPGWEVLIYLTVIVIGVGFLWAGHSEPEAACALIA